MSATISTGDLAKEAKLVECPALGDSRPEFKTTYDVEPHGELTGFDDSGWDAVPPADLGGKRGGGTKANPIIYRATQLNCRHCPLKDKCCPKEPARKIHRSIHEDARDLARALASTEAYAHSRHDRKKVEILFAHLKRILRFERLPLPASRRTSAAL